MEKMFETIFRPFLTNEIVVNWIAPIITGLIVVAIPTIIVKIFRLRQDRKKVREANQRFLDSIRPYIIQEIEISASFITDIRDVVINESGLKDKYVYSEMQLRNKLIMDINESKYIDENNKDKLIKFTYDVFKHFSVNDKVIVKQDSNSVNNLNFQFFKIPIILFAISFTLMVIGVCLNGSKQDPLDDPVIALPFLLGIFSLVMMMVPVILSLIQSDVQKNTYLDDFMNLLIQKRVNEIKKKNREKKD